MNPEFTEYSEVVGKILANLQSLEFSIRLYLHNTQDPDSALFKGDFSALRVGDEVPENSLTDYSSMGPLIDRYNGCVPADLAVDRTLVDLRDALAHSRMFLPSVTSPPVLIKFQKPVAGKTSVSFVQTSSSEWLAACISRVHLEMLKVQRSLGHAV
ncbi:MAG: hypothetical protein ABI565_08340 [Vicinamibacteria bacterium]